MTKIYTRVGDKGTTSLADGTRVLKNSARINAYGNIDELNSSLGMVRDQVELLLSADEIVQKVMVVQNELFELGGELSLPPEIVNKKSNLIGSRQIQRLEAEIDEWNEVLPPLKNFVLPGGHPLNSMTHLARTICRRAERELVAATEIEEIREDVLSYLNRLSDWLFVCARYLSHLVNAEEVLWNQSFNES